MTDAMRLLPLEGLLARICEEYRARRSIFGLPETLWYRAAVARTLDIMRERVEMPLGPAAGPHTQLAQNIVSAYLTGSRFIELKTVQILDALEIDKPCIDAADEAYNVEWSTELSLDNAWLEYARAWIALHVIEELFGLAANPDRRSFAFNMSVGYNMEGIQSERMQQYLARMTGREADPRIARMIDRLDRTIRPLLAGTGLALSADGLERVRTRSSAPLCSSVTLSTMHGCPPDEIEAICRHMIADQQIDTFVKLNPTLLGLRDVRTMLDGLGYQSVELDEAGFAHDLQWDDAVAILQRLRASAADRNVGFGVKLTNTLAVNNTRGKLPGDQMYLSGRALYPLSINVAARISREFAGDLPISYCGGITVHNAADVLRTGIRPLTLCTVLLKPGGYTRQVQIARELEGVAVWPSAGVDVDGLWTLAERALIDPTVHKRHRGTDEVRISGTLPVTDCYQAPCVSACAIGQHVPEYIRLVGEERYADALELIAERNALPAITAHICDHQCQYACSRLDHDGCLNIRELKKIAVQKGDQEYRSRRRRGAPESGATARRTRCAVIGAGPAGLSAAYFLARAGFPVTVFEREAHAGGVVRNVIPEFRLPVEAIERDIEFIEEAGVEFRFGVDSDLSIEALRSEGFGPVFVGIGAEVGNEIDLSGDGSRVVRSLDFLWNFRGNKLPLEVGRRVVVVGGGNTAMDAARAAMNLPHVDTVDVLYRRTESEMPADLEEYENARADGVRFHFLRNPEAISQDGTITARVMKLGEPDGSGRRRPIATAETEELAADTLITAVGERADTAALARMGIPVGEDGRLHTDAETLETALADVYLGGDSLTGPSTVVRCIASGRRAADAITRRDDEARRAAGIPALPARPEPVGLTAVQGLDREARLAQIGVRKATVTLQPDAHRYHDARAFAQREYERCLDCSFVCNRCVEVCPNRANITVSTSGDPLFSDPFQIVHLDAYCNECGNCGHFCPWDQNVPYRDKPTVFSAREDFDASNNDGWLVEGDVLVARYGGSVSSRPLSAVLSAPDPAVARFDRLFALLYRERPSLFEPMEAMR